jgi:hypothetical protein
MGRLLIGFAVLGAIGLGQTSCLFMHSHYLLFYSYSLDQGKRVQVEGSDKVFSATSDDTIQLLWDEVRWQRVAENFEFRGVLRNLAEDPVEITGMKLRTEDETCEGAPIEPAQTPFVIEVESEQSVIFLFDVEVGDLDLGLVFTLFYTVAGQPRVFEIPMTGHGY